jgi:hypothetical protein
VRSRPIASLTRTERRPTSAPAPSTHDRQLVNVLALAMFVLLIAMIVLGTAVALTVSLA